MKKTIAQALLLTLAFTASTAAQSATVVLDTGHTPKRGGVVSAYGRPEYGFNAQLAHYVAQHLATRGIEVVRVQGEYTLTQRTRATSKADLFVSLHHDSIPQAWIDAGKRNQYSGFSVFVSRKNPRYRQSVACAQQIGGHLSQAGERPSLYHATPIKGENRALIDKRSGTHVYDDLVVLKTAKSPAVLVEAGVIINPQEDRRLGDPSVAKALGQSIAEGIVRCLGKK